MTSGKSLQSTPVNSSLYNMSGLELQMIFLGKIVVFHCLLCFFQGMYNCTKSIPMMAVLLPNVRRFQGQLLKNQHSSESQILSRNPLILPLWRSAVHHTAHPFHFLGRTRVSTLASQPDLGLVGSFKWFHHVSSKLMTISLVEPWSLDLSWPKKVKSSEVHQATPFRDMWQVRYWPRRKMSVVCLVVSIL